MLPDMIREVLDNDATIKKYAEVRINSLIILAVSYEDGMASIFR